MGCGSQVKRNSTAVAGAVRPGPRPPPGMEAYPPAAASLQLRPGIALNRTQLPRPSSRPRPELACSQGLDDAGVQMPGTLAQLSTTLQGRPTSRAPYGNV